MTPIAPARKLCGLPERSGLPLPLAFGLEGLIAAVLRQSEERLYFPNVVCDFDS